MGERDYPRMAAEEGRVEPAPRRVRGTIGSHLVFDTTNAVYLWEWAGYPQYGIPAADVGDGMLESEDRTEERTWGTARRHGIRVEDEHRPDAAWVFDDTAGQGVAGMVRFDWAALDAWFEEDEEVFVHPRNPYARVDALRSQRHVRVEVDGVLVAESTSPVMLFETGLPTRYYLPRTDVHFEHLVPTDQRTSCPYKGTTSHYWSVRAGGTVHEDLAWAYDFPAPEARQVAGLVCFYNEKCDILIDGRPERGAAG